MVTLIGQMITMNEHVTVLPKNRYLIMWTNRRALDDGSFEKYEVQTATPDLEQAKETFDTVSNEEVDPVWLIDLHMGKIIKSTEQ